MDLSFPHLPLHSPQTALQRKVIYNGVKIFLGQNCRRKSSVGPWQTDNIYEEDNLCNVVSTMLGQHCTEILSSQCCPNTSETMLCNVGLEHTNTFSQEKNLYNVVLIWMCQHCTRKLPAQC